MLVLSAVAFGANASTVAVTSETDYGSGSVTPVQGDAAPNDNSGTYATGVYGNDNNNALSPYVNNPNYSYNQPDNGTGPALYYNVISAGSNGKGTATYNLSAGATTYKLLWGSPDNYNNVLFYTGANDTGTLIGEINGDQLACYTGNTCKDTSASLVTFTATGTTIGFVELTDNGTAAFEFGTVSATPLPAALPLFATGLGLVGFLGQRRKRRTARTATA